MDNLRRFQSLANKNTRPRTQQEQIRFMDSGGKSRYGCIPQSNAVTGEVSRRPQLSRANLHIDDKLAGRMDRTDPATFATPENSVNSLALDIVVVVGGGQLIVRFFVSNLVSRRRKTPTHQIVGIQCSPVDCIMFRRKTLPDSEWLALTPILFSRFSLRSVG